MNIRRNNGGNAVTDKESWIDIGSADELAQTPLMSCKVGTTAIAVSFRDGQFGAISNVCNHVGGPLGEGRLDGDYITCPWHGWKFHYRSGVGEPGFEEDRVPASPVKVESGRVLVNRTTSRWLLAKC
jgi:nitrite reductase/ring-hydroxylating ferredoxin subunit